MLLNLKKTLLLVLLCFSIGSPSAWADEGRFDGVARIVAIADIHGAYDAMVATLQNAGILSDELAWSGDASHLVIVGDILDRGPKSRAAMDLLMRLEGEAQAAGGKVHVLIGNHEAMLLEGDMRYVSKAEYEAFAADEDSAERARWFSLYVEQKGGEAAALQANFDKKFPPGYFAMRRAFRPDGEYGQWLLTKNIIAVINGTAFVHGGLSPMVRKYGLDGINTHLRQELRTYLERLALLTDAEILLPTDSSYDYEAILTNFVPSLNEQAETLRAVEAIVESSSTSVTDYDGPLWYRNNILCPGIVEEHRLEESLAAIGADRVVIGHTPTPNREVVQRFDGRVIQIDTGMLNFYYKGIGHALIIEGDSLYATNQRGEEVREFSPQLRSVGERSDDLTARQLQELLSNGEILSVQKATVNLSRQVQVKVSDGEHTVDALFFESKNKGVYPGVAAYRLDRLLDLEMVPVTVKRAVEGDEGSLQFAPTNTTDERERSQSGEGGGAWCSLAEQWPSMYVFDALIYNEARTPYRILYDRSSWRLILSEHDRTFPTKKGRPQHLRKTQLDISDGWKEAMSELSDEILAENLGDVLDSRRMKALQSRRDKLIEGQ